jgi:hypothetical protein
VTRNNKTWSEANVSGTLNFGSSVKTVRQKTQHIPKINVPESISIRVVGSGEQGMKKKVFILILITLNISSVVEF